MIWLNTPVLGDLPRKRQAPQQEAPMNPFSTQIPMAGAPSNPFGTNIPMADAGGFDLGDAWARLTNSGAYGDFAYGQAKGGEAPKYSEMVMSTMNPWDSWFGGNTQNKEMADKIENMRFDSANNQFLTQAGIMPGANADYHNTLDNSGQGEEASRAQAAGPQKAVAAIAATILSMGGTSSTAGTSASSVGTSAMPSSVWDFASTQAGKASSSGVAKALGTGVNWGGIASGVGEGLGIMNQLSDKSPKDSSQIDTSMINSIIASLSSKNASNGPNIQMYQAPMPTVANGASDQEIARSGVISEPVIGKGLVTGKTYSFGENKPEQVSQIPGAKPYANQTFPDMQNPFQESMASNPFGTNVPMKDAGTVDPVTTVDPTTATKSWGWEDTAALAVNAAKLYVDLASLGKNGTMPFMTQGMRQQELDQTKTIAQQKQEFERNTELMKAQTEALKAAREARKEEMDTTEQLKKDFFRESDEIKQRYPMDSLGKFTDPNAEKNMQADYANLVNRYGNYGKIIGQEVQYQGYGVKRDKDGKRVKDNNGSYVLNKKAVGTKIYGAPNKPNAVFWDPDNMTALEPITTWYYNGEGKKPRKREYKAGEIVKTEFGKGNYLLEDQTAFKD